MASPQPTNPKELEAVLNLLLTSEGTQVKQAEAILKVFLKNPTCVTPLMQQLVENPNVGPRQMAAVLLRGRIFGHWVKLAESVQTDIKKALLVRLVTEPHRLVRIALASLISEVGKRTIPDGQWNDLLQALLQCCQSQNGDHREVAMMIFRSLAENVGEHLRPHMAALKVIFERGLADPNKGVQTEALKGIALLVLLLEEDEQITQYSAVIPKMCQVVTVNIQQGNEDVVAAAFESFENLADVASPILTHQLPPVVNLMLGVVVNRQVDGGAREKASMFLTALIKAKPGKFVKHNLVAPCLQACFLLVVEPWEDVFEPQGEMTPQKLGLELLDSIFLHLPQKMVFAPALQHASKLLASPNEVERKGGLVILAVMAEGCADPMKDQLAPLVDVVCKSFGDPSALVKAAACVALTQFADHLLPDVLDFHEKVLPIVFVALAPASEGMVQKKSCVALEVFCENLGEDIKPYLPVLMERLMTLLVSSPDVSVKEACVSAVKAAAASAGPAFLPFFDKTIAAIAQFMARTEEDWLKLRSAATECAGAMAAAVGKDKFAAYLQQFMQQAMKGMTLDYFQLRECTHQFFASIATMLQDEFAPFLPNVMTLIVASCKSDDGVVVDKASDALDIGAGLSGIAEDSDPEEEEEDDGAAQNLRFSIRSGALDEKVQALISLATIITAVGKAFLPYLNTCLDALAELSEYPHHHVRQAVVTAYGEILSLIHTCFPNPHKWARGKPTALTKEAQAVVSRLFPELYLRMTQEEDKSTCAQACDTMVEALRFFGAASITFPAEFGPEEPSAPFSSHLARAMATLMAEKAPCQTDYDADDPEKADHDEVLIDSVTDLVGMFAQLTGPSFEPCFRQMFPSVLKFLQDHRAPSDRSMAIGCIAEVADELGQAFAPYLKTVWPVVIKGLGDKDVPIRRNSAFCAGVMFDAVPSAPELQALLPPILNALRPLFVVKEKNKRKEEALIGCRDNAASCLARMIKHHAASLPMDQVIPVLLSALPLTSDFTETKNTYPVVCKLFTTHAQLMVAQLPAVVPILGQAIGHPLVDATAQSLLVQLAKQLFTQLPEPMKALVGKLPPQEQTSLAAALR